MEGKCCLAQDGNMRVWSTYIVLFVYSSSSTFIVRQDLPLQKWPVSDFLLSSLPVSLKQYSKLHKSLPRHSSIYVSSIHPRYQHLPVHHPITLIPPLDRPHRTLYHHLEPI